MVHDENSVQDAVNNNEDDIKIPIAMVFLPLFFCQIIVKQHWIKFFFGWCPPCLFLSAIVRHQSIGDVLLSPPVSNQKDLLFHLTFAREATQVRLIRVIVYNHCVMSRIFHTKRTCEVTRTRFLSIRRYSQNVIYRNPIKGMDALNNQTRKKKEKKQK